MTLRAVFACIVRLCGYVALVEFALFVSGSGGSLRSGCALYDIVRYVDGDVSALALGIVASVSSIVFVAATV